MTWNKYFSEKLNRPFWHNSITKEYVLKNPTDKIDSNSDKNFGLGKLVKILISLIGTILKQEKLFGKYLPKFLNKKKKKKLLSQNLQLLLKQKKKNHDNIVSTVQILGK